MAANGDSAEFLPAGLTTLGIEFDEVEMAVMSATHELYWPAIAGFLEVDLSAVAPEPNAEMSKPPQA